MQHEPSPQEITMIIPFTIEDFKKNLKIRSTRHRLLIVLSLQFVLTIICFIAGAIFSMVYHISFDKSSKTLSTNVFIGTVIAAGIDIIYYIAFIIMVIGYRRIGILIFTWVIIISMIIVYVEAIIITTTGFSFTKNNIKIATNLVVLDTIAECIAGLLDILTIIFSFKLTGLMKELKIHRMAENLNI